MLASAEQVSLYRFSLICELHERRSLLFWQAAHVVWCIFLEILYGLFISAWLLLVNNRLYAHSILVNSLLIKLVANFKTHKTYLFQFT